ncbi:hypothetical protein P1X15_07270 [Runella sp. MFBS21]|uniref:hypothetical protein n=1 Tax=Runella sp. MFBS21 TaxID=3034018 RepID=UPI0023FA3ABC|nr:hypothetical protein [Runella sp. MFBS21]MDF7817387.1 hypothetical protein [Runella sp. MFBS21]
MVTVNEIGGFEQATNAGYVRTLYLLDIAHLEGIIDPLTFPNHLNSLTIPSNGLIIPVGCNVDKLGFQPKSCLFTETTGRDANGIYYDANFVLEFPRDRVEVLSWVQATRYREYAAIWEDYNGTAYLTGCHEMGLEVQSSRSVASRNAVTLSITGRFGFPSYYLETINLTDLFAVADFSFEFSFDFNA